MSNKLLIRSLILTVSLTILPTVAQGLPNRIVELQGEAQINKMTKAQALKKAQESLLKDTPLDCEQSSSDNTDFTHPHYWAPFILIGNGL